MLPPKKPVQLPQMMGAGGGMGNPGCLLALTIIGMLTTLLLGGARKGGDQR